MRVVRTSSNGDAFIGALQSMAQAMAMLG